MYKNKHTHTHTHIIRLRNANPNEQVKLSTLVRIKLNITQGFYFLTLEAKKINIHSKYKFNFETRWLLEIKTHCCIPVNSLAILRI